MKRLLLSIFLILLVSVIKSQVPVVSFQQEIKGFDGGVALPAQKNFVISGNISVIITRVEVEIYQNSKMDKLFYSSSWLRMADDKSTSFNVPVNTMLRSNDEYTFKLNFYTGVEKEDHLQIVDMLQVALSEYVNTQTRIRNKYLIFNKPSEAMLDDMNAIVNAAFNSYDLEEFRFSDIVADKIKQIESLKINTSYEEVNSITSLDELKNLLSSEVRAYLPQHFKKIAYHSIVVDYPTQKLPNVLGLNLGYGAAFIEKTNIGYAPYAGISIPLGNLAFAPFMSKISLSAGVFVTDITDENNIVFSGPVIKRPIYLGLGYRVYDFIRVNAGAVILENTSIPANDLLIRPYVGLSIDLNLWIGLGKQRPYSND